MIDITKKYWIDYGPIAVLCSITRAIVVINLQQRKLFTDDDSPILGIENYNISEQAKSIFLAQKEKGYLSPTALPNMPDTIEALKELENLGYIVFYDVDEPIGYNLTDDMLEPYDSDNKDLSDGVIPNKTLDQLRIERWNSIADSYTSNGYPRPIMPSYPDKKYGFEWYEFIPG